MVKVDDVYQKVLALANKEQRGYITPQDFNLFASQAQLEIFEQYFYDLNKARKSQGNDTVIADIDDILEDKISRLVREFNPIQTAALAGSGGGKDLGTLTIHRLLRTTLLNTSTGLQIECELLSTKDFENNKVSPLTKPSPSRPIVKMQNKVITCNDGGANKPPYAFTYIRTPHKPNWTYTVINKKAMYSPGANTRNFQLHESEEIQLVNKILRLAGLATQQVDVMRSGGAMESMIKQQKI